jgi:hypothetical protein
LKSLPNSFKSLALSKTNIVLEDVYLLPSNITNQVPSIYDPKNMEKIYQLFHNTMTIEYLDTFVPNSEEVNVGGKLEKIKGTAVLLKAPVWKTLNQKKIQALEAGANAVALLCRLTRYVNKELGVGYDKLQFPIIDKYFLMAVDPLKPLATAIEVLADSDYVEASVDVGGNDGFPNEGDVQAMADFPDWNKFRWLELDGEAILVKEFDGMTECAPVTGEG